eukprot:1972608-Prymnesium_polylepis.1
MHGRRAPHLLQRADEARSAAHHRRLDWHRQPQRREPRAHARARVQRARVEGDHICEEVRERAVAAPTTAAAAAAAAAVSACTTVQDERSGCRRLHHAQRMGVQLSPSTLARLPRRQQPH